jgi:ribosomal protein S18 acetylase RimI-like enzyme
MHSLPQFYKTIDKAVDFEPARTIGFYIWCKPYLELSPGTCFVLDDGAGRAVGYIIGTASTVTLIGYWKMGYVSQLHRSNAGGLFPLGGPSHDEPSLVKELRGVLNSAGCSMLENYPEILKRYPAHLHIDILPEFQNKGWGPQLMETFLTKVKQMGADGVHLGMVRSNRGAKRFYERLGFRVCDVVLDNGKSGELGVADDALCMVKEL